MSQALFNLHRQVLRVFEAPDKPSVITDLLLPDRMDAALYAGGADHSSPTAQGD